MYIASLSHATHQWPKGNPTTSDFTATTPAFFNAGEVIFVF
jgi:hypothetical protein